MQSAPNPPPACVVALWHMDETTGTVMARRGGEPQRHAAERRARQPGFAGLAYGFTGSSTVLVPSAADLNAGAKTLTVDDPPEGDGVPATPDWDLIRKGVFTTAGGEFKVEYQPSGQGTCGFNTSTNYAELTAGPALNDGQWHTVQCVKTATNIQLIVDGAEVHEDRVARDDLEHRAAAVGSHPGVGVLPRVAGRGEHPDRLTPAWLSGSGAA